MDSGATSRLQAQHQAQLPHPTVAGGALLHHHLGHHHFLSQSGLLPHPSDGTLQGGPPGGGGGGAPAGAQREGIHVHRHALAGGRAGLAAAEDGRLLPCWSAPPLPPLHNAIDSNATIW